MIGYIILLGVFVAMVSLCFVPGLIEYYRPKDAGPLKIDMNRNIEERHFSKSFRKMINNAFGDPAAPSRSVMNPGANGILARMVSAETNKGLEDVVEVDGDLTLAKGAVIKEALVVRGNLTAGDSCVFSREVLVDGNAIIGENTSLVSLSATNIEIGKSGRIEGWLDADETIMLREGCSVKSRVTAGKKITLESRVKTPRLAAPEIVLGAAPVDSIPEAIPDINWTAAMDDYITEHFLTDSLPDIKQSLNNDFRVSVSEIKILFRAALLDLVAPTLYKLEKNDKPDYLRSNTVWLQGKTTARIKGNIEFPAGEDMPFNLIVTGNLTSGENTIFRGGVHVDGRVKTGESNRFRQSLVANNDIYLGDNNVIENCVDTDRDITTGRGVSVGLGIDGGGMSAGGRITITDGFRGHNKAFADYGVIAETGGNEIVA